MTSRLAVLITLVLLSAVARAELTVENAWVRAGPPTAAVLAGYMTLTNTGSEAATLVGATSEQFLRVEMHRTEIDDKGMARMYQIEKQQLEPGATLQFKPGGDHLMLIKPKKPLKVGDHVVLKLTLADGSTLDVDATVGSGDEAAGHGHNH